LKAKLLLLVVLPVVLSLVVGFAAAQTETAAPSAAVNYDKVAIAFAAALAIGLPGLGAGLAISAAGSAAISALAEKPETFFRSFLIVALAEALAIYGLILGILLWLKL
jgi:V/A-type H+/Na+-transporting ATPase subunit K